MSFLTTTANHMAKFLQAYLEASKEDKKLSPKDFAFLTIKGALPGESKLSVVKEDPEEDEEATEKDSDLASSEEEKGKKGKVIVVLNTRKTPKPGSGVIAPDHLLPKLLKCLDGVADSKKVARKYPGADFDQDSLGQVLKLLKKQFDVEQVEYSEFEGPSWIKPKTKPATKGKPGPKPGQKKAGKKAEVVEVEDDDEEEKPKSGKKAAPTSSKKSKKQKEEEEEEEEEEEKPKKKAGKAKKVEEEDDGF